MKRPKKTPFRYSDCKVDRILDGDTADLWINLGFSTFVKKRVRFYGINCPETRTRDKAEKVLGMAAKDRLIELCGSTLAVQSLGKGKYGRILGIPYTDEGKDICKILISEGHAVEYWGGTKKKVWA